MAEQPVDDEKNNEESFEDLLDAYSPVMGEDVQIGDKIRGEIISIGSDSVFVDTGTKIDGVVEKADLLDETGQLPFKEGDILELYVDSYNGNEIRLSKALTGAGGIQAIHEAYENSVPVEGKVKAECKGGFQVEIMGRRAFCPISQMDLRYIETPKDYTGEIFPFLVMQFEEDGRNIVVSRRELLLRDQEKKANEFLSTLQVDQCLEGRVTKLMPYGAFIELCPGIEGMVHISEISWSRLERPEDKINPGDNVTVKIMGLEKKGDSGQIKISLSMKQVSDDPWNLAQDNFPVGAKVKGVVTRCMKFGAFVEIAPGIEGLVHISEMSYKRRVLKPEDIAAPGDPVEVMIKEVDPDRRRISLSIKDAEGDPWVDIRSRYRIGQSVKGTLERKEAFGFFISLEPGITGLMPRSKFGSAQRASILDGLKEGGSLTVLIEEILPMDRKMTLIPADPEDEADWKQYTRSADQGMGTLGEKLKNALKSKD